MKKESGGINIPDVSGNNIDVGNSSYDIPGLKINRRCGQMACSYNPEVITGGFITPNPLSELSNLIASGQVASGITPQQALMEADFAANISVPDFYPWLTGM